MIDYSPLTSREYAALMDKLSRALRLWDVVCHYTATADTDDRSTAIAMSREMSAAQGTLYERFTEPVNAPGGPSDDAVRSFATNPSESYLASLRAQYGVSEVITGPDCERCGNACADRDECDLYLDGVSPEFFYNRAPQGYLSSHTQTWGK